MKKLLAGLLCAPFVALASERSVEWEETARAEPGEAREMAPLVNAGQIVAITHNIAGELAYGGGTDAIALVNALIGGGKQPDVIALQEVCAPQASAFWNTNYPRGYWAAFYPTKYKPACGGSGEANHGNLIAVRTEYGPSGPYNLLLTGNLGHGMICIDFTKEAKVFRACSTHLIAGSGPDDDTRLAQARQIKSWANSWVGAGYRVIVGGDFNSAPSSAVIQSLNHLAGGSPFIDADFSQNRATKRRYSNDCNDPAWNSKLDYMFFSSNLTGRNLVEATLRGDGTCSDHRALMGTARLK